MDVNHVLRRLRAACEAEGSQVAFARRHRVSSAYVNDVLRGHREPGPMILAALNIVRVVRYLPSRPKP